MKKQLIKTRVMDLLEAHGEPVNWTTLHQYVLIASGVKPCDAVKEGNKSYRGNKIAGIIIPYNKRRVSNKVYCCKAGYMFYPSKNEQRHLDVNFIGDKAEYFVTR